MIQKTAKKLSAFIVAHGLPVENEEVYSYGAECLLSLFITYCLLLICSFILKRIPEMIIWIISFSLLRNHLGGYHANSHWKCILSTIILGITSMYIKNFWFINNISIFFAILTLVTSLLIVIKIAPVLHPNHPILSKQRDKEGKISIVILLLEILIIIITYFIAPNLSNTIITSIFLAITLAIIGYYFN